MDGYRSAELNHRYISKSLCRLRFSFQLMPGTGLMAPSWWQATYVCTHFTLTFLTVSLREPGCRLLAVLSRTFPGSSCSPNHLARSECVPGQVPPPWELDMYIATRERCFGTQPGRASITVPSLAGKILTVWYLVSMDKRGLYPRPGWL